MTNQIETRDVLENAQDLAVIENLGDDRFIYAVKPSLDVQKYFFDLSVQNPEDTNIPVYSGHWGFDKDKGITGSNTYLTLRFDRLALRPSGLWVPGLLEAKTLESQGKLENGVYRDYGVVVYNNERPNEDIAETLTSKAKRLGLEFPLVTPFRALTQDDETGLPNGFVKSPEGMLSGSEAQKDIDDLHYKADSGVRRLDRFTGGSWIAIWYFLDDSYEHGRVDWICAEGTRADLEQAHERVLERNYSERINSLRDEMNAKQNEFSESLDN